MGNSINIVRVNSRILSVDRIINAEEINRFLRRRDLSTTAVDVTTEIIVVYIRLSSRRGLIGNNQ